MRRPKWLQLHDHVGGMGGQPGWKVKWAQVIGPDECPMMVRWVLECPWGSIRLHHFLRPDDMRHLHDHPWWFVTLLLRGSYRDIGEVDGQRVVSDMLRPGSVRFRPAHHVHAVDTAGCWSLVITGPIQRRWGFWDAGIFRRAAEYFGRYGYAPCQD